MTREEQIKDAAINFASNPKGEGEHISIYCRGKEMGFKAGAEWALRQSPWISVDDELPPLLKKVYVYSIVYSRFGEWQTQRFIEPDGKEHTDIEEHGFYTGSAPYYSPHMQITHWRPMSLFPDKY